ncbi:hypothetical protein NUH86_14860 [Sphingobium sp. JS3065]|uniref:hypothetical protein n=1 Tax=Sphingobium sp. JS3065 TaxID=2970925 RepID=UPI0022650166|nr:hypothetical protein [Sphingobium sp. JS3065]UZW54749.1 hypothetical protein NUH86_14860 [Sphingobium sp. JS3065]
MDEGDIHEASSNNSKSIMWISLLFLGLGYLIGGLIEGDRKEQAALNWTVRTTADCESSYKAEEFDNVTDCVKETIAALKEEKRDEARTEDHDPRR